MVLNLETALSRKQTGRKQPSCPRSGVEQGQFHQRGKPSVFAAVSMQSNESGNERCRGGKKFRYALSLYAPR